MKNALKPLADPVVLPFRRPRVVQIECQDNIEFMLGLKKNSMHLIVTSPPYNIGKSYESRAPNEDYVKSRPTVTPFSRPIPTPFR
ncbi:MAG: hypothetical protein RL274_2695 [Pseudomonadota bacterium]|jgi:adenine-specific DNA-methyltransferase